MKKTTILLGLIFVISCMVLAGCGGSGGDSSADLSDSKYLGTWQAESMSLGDDSEAFEDEVFMTLNGDGTGVMTSADEESSFTWEEIDGGFKTAGDVKMTFTDEGDGFVGKVIGVELHFVKAE